jgi:RNA polymerase sigma-70 factor (ECF subfamily)
MAEGEPTPPLWRISTHWDLLYEAHRGEGEAVSEAKRLLLLRYGDAVYRYLFKAVRDPEAAAELSQEFALRFLRGDFRRIQQEKGRFRDFLGTVLYHLIIDYHRRNQARPAPLPNESKYHPATPSEIDVSEEQFTAEWKQELLNRAWQTLEAAEKEQGRLFYTVLRWRSENPQVPAARLAEELQAQLDRPFTEDGIRQTLRRAREKYAQALLAEVARSLEDPSPRQVEEELSDLGLLVYCQPVLATHTSPS